MLTQQPNERRVGFTGTRFTPSKDQEYALRGVLRGVTIFHHGCCVGADEMAWKIAHEFGAWTVGHPPKEGKLRAKTRDNLQHKPLPYLDRNRAIVDSTDELVACPLKMTEEQRSGTWATIRYARTAGKPITIVWPDGSITKENQKS